MNTTSNNNTGNTVDNTDRRSREKSGGSGIGNKVRGAVEVIHGVGENIRGTTLGALDTLSKDPTTKHDETAQKGRLQTERGLSELRGGKPPSHVQSSSTNPTQPTYGKHSSTTNPGATGSNQAGEQGGMPASTSYGSETGFQGNPGTIHGGPQATRYPNMAGQASAGDSLGTQNPLGAGVEPNATTGSIDASQTGAQPDANYQHLRNTSAYGSAAVVPESTNYPSPGHHREDAVGSIPERQLEGQQTAYVHPYNPAQNPSGGPDLKQLQQAYASETQSSEPSFESNTYNTQN